MKGEVQPGRPCEVCRSLKKLEIEAAICRSERISHISQQYAISKYSIYRHLKNHAAQEVHDAFRVSNSADVASLASRIVDIADSVRAVRLAARTEELILKAAAMELKALESIANRFGIDHEDAVDGIEGAKSLARALGTMTRDSPELREKLLETLVEQGSEGLAHALESGSP